MTVLHVLIASFPLPPNRGNLAGVWGEGGGGEEEGISSLKENDYSVPISTVNTAPPLNSSPCNPAVFDFNEFLQYLRSLLKATVQTDSSLGV